MFSCDFETSCASAGVSGGKTLITVKRFLPFKNEKHFPPK